MKKVTTILAAILLMAVGAAAQKLSYQAVVRNSSNELVPNTALTVEVSILDAVGAVQYAETHSATTNQNGLLVLTIGDGTVTAGTTVADVNWNGAAIQSVVKNGGAVVATITSPVNAVPYALYAETAGGGIVTEEDPTVPDWAKEPTKPAYDYSEIINTPTIPTVNDGTLTITLPDGTSETFTANQAGNTTVAIPAPAAMTAEDLLSLVSGMTEEQKEALRDALGVTGGGSDPATFVCGTSKMVDADRNEYETVLIGTQCWTKTNLRVAPAGATDASSSGASSNTEPYYYVNSAVNLAVYGYYYNWEAAKLACPTGWHLPSDAEWTTMEQTQTSMDVTGTAGWHGDHAGKLAGEGWDASSTVGAPGNATDPDHNASGFSAVPASYWYNRFYSAGSSTYFWSSTECGSSSAWRRCLNFSRADVDRYGSGRTVGISVRCLRD